jgi:glycosyltransferase involved in cell wall biosynthesis
MHVVHLISTICRGGAETQLLTLAREQVSQGHRVSIYYLKGDPELEQEFTSCGVKVHHELVGLNFFSQKIRLQKLLKTHAGVLHAHLPKAELVASLINRKCILVLSKHNAEKFYPSGNRVLSKILAKFVSRRSDGIVYISRAVQEFTVKISENSKSTPSWIIYYGYNSRFLNTFGESHEALIGNQLVIGTISRLVKQKDLTTLLRAVALQSESGFRSRLVVVGRGPDRQQLENYSKTIGIHDAIRWTDMTTDVYSEISQMDIFCLTSRYEGFGLVLLEAMQCQVPIIASRNSAIIEVLGSEYPYLFETSNSDDLSKKIGELTNLTNRKEAIDYLKGRLLLFSPREMCLNIENVYKKLLNSDF